MELNKSLFTGLTVKTKETKMNPQPTKQFNDLWLDNDNLYKIYRTKRRVHIPPVNSKEYESGQVRRECKVLIKTNT